jgi:exopolyphosphatase/guanosine-5'-triphosphate,3'-diphosphate pyrophosphatase
VPPEWLTQRPLTQRALEEEAVHWHAVGMKYQFG